MSCGPSPKLQPERVTATDSTLVRAASIPASVPASDTDSDSATWLTQEQLWARYNLLRGDAYQLDSAPRRLDSEQKRVTCDPEGMQLYRGAALSFGGAVRVHPAFAERLARFESLVTEVALSIYGRAPTAVRHLGAFACRKSRFRSRRISEHALGNAIDITGFDFGPAPKSERAALPKHLRWNFSVRVERHFNATRGEAALVHREFLHTLTQRLIEDETFRVMLGPGHRGHENHFHFDMSPWSYVSL
jgi:hypothetical protein